MSGCVREKGGSLGFLCRFMHHDFVVFFVSCMPEIVVPAVKEPIELKERGEQTPPKLSISFGGSNEMEGEKRS